MGNESLTNEAELLLLCSRVNLNHEEKERVNLLCSDDMDWNLFIRLAIKNRVHCLAFNTLKHIDCVKKLPFLKDLKNIALATAARNLFISTFLQKLMVEFKQNGIFVMPFKGPVLSEEVYGDSSCRHFSDLDLLVCQSDALHALKLLKREFSAQQNLKESQLKKYIDDEDHFSFYDPTTKIIIELHWDLTGLYLSRCLTVSRLKRFIKTGHLNGKTIPCLSKESLLVYLCVHGAKHGWDNLEQLCSVSAALRSGSCLNWETVKTLSEKWRCRRMVQLSLYMAWKHMGDPLPETILRDIKSKQSFFAATSGKIMNNLFFGDESGFSNRFSFFHIRIRDNLADKLRYGFRLLFRPTDKEWFHFGLPASLSFFHCLLRPLRLFVEKTRGQNA